MTANLTAVPRQDMTKARPKAVAGCGLAPIGHELGFRRRSSHNGPQWTSVADEQRALVRYAIQDGAGADIIFAAGTTGEWNRMDNPRRQLVSRSQWMNAPNALSSGRRVEGLGGNNRQYASGNDREPRARDRDRGGCRGSRAAFDHGC